MGTVHFGKVSKSGRPIALTTMYRKIKSSYERLCTTRVFFLRAIKFYTHLHHLIGEAHALFTDDVICWDANVVEVDHGRVGAAHPHLNRQVRLFYKLPLTLDHIPFKVSVL